MHNVDTTLVERTVTARSFCPPGCPSPSRRAARFFFRPLALVGFAGWQLPVWCWRELSYSHHSQTRRKTCDNVIFKQSRSSFMTTIFKPGANNSIKSSDFRKFVCAFCLELTHHRFTKLRRQRQRVPLTTPIA